MEKLTEEQISALPEWIPVRDFEGLYEVNCRAGLVRNARTLRVRKSCADTGGYPCVFLSKDGRHYTKNVHRIVANAAFGYYNIPTDGFDVCHLDEERWDARISNLALGSRKENLKFEQYKKRKSEAQKGKPNIKLSKRVGAYKNGELVMIFQSTMDAHRKGFTSSEVSRCCRGKYKTHKGFEWRFL